MRLFKRLLFKLFVNVLASSCFILPKIRCILLKIAGIKLQTNTVKPHCYFHTNDISIGQGTLINHYCKFFSSDKPGGNIIIGNKCFIAMNVLFTTKAHEIGTAGQRAGQNSYYPIIIEDGCWIGANSTILPGVKIERGCIIAAGSVVNKNCAPNGLYAGVPARRIKDLA